MQIALDFPPKVGHSLQETFMSFKPGDVVVYVSCRDVRKNGLEATVLAVGERFVDAQTGAVRHDGVLTTLSNPAKDSTGTRAKPESLRLKRPPPDEFQPAEPEFVSDLLKRLGRVSA